MFTGLVEDVGTIAAIRGAGGGKELLLRCPKLPLDECALGDSIAVDGACLTVDRFEGKDGFVAVAGRETLAHTTLADARVGQRVHLERALRLGDRLGGHLVQGHVDGVGRVTRVEDRQETWILWVHIPEELRRYVAPKGSLTLDGVSLTVNEIDDGAARLNIVPHTRRVTHLGEKRPGQGINLEVDVLAKYVERLLGAREPGKSTLLSALARNGFLD
ncbi:MAG: riboflavin synthase [Deltaproteobacteria bacterium]|nr:MAG: riboflavin synthase [Deltaproteobacteria bacterium]